MNIQSVAILLLLTATGCGTGAVSDMDPAETPDGGPDPAVRPLTCAVIEGPNCWSEAVAAVRACAPGGEIEGQLSSNPAACTYPTGTVVTFGGAPTPPSFDVDHSFEARMNGALCVGFEHVDETASTDDIRTLRTVHGTATWSLGERLRLSCPDGAVYETSVLEALACEAFPNVLGFSAGGDATRYTFALMDRDELVDVLSCSLP